MSPPVLVVAGTKPLRLWLVQVIRGEEKDSPCPRVSKTGSRFWRRWRKGLSSSPTTAGYVSAEAAWTRNQSAAWFLWRGGSCLCISSKLDFKLHLTSRTPWCFLTHDPLPCRYESLDDLESWRHAPVSGATFGFPSSTLGCRSLRPRAGTAPPATAPGPFLSRKYVSMDPAHHGRWLNIEAVSVVLFFLSVLHLGLTHTVYMCSCHGDRSP